MGQTAPWEKCNIVTAGYAFLECYILVSITCTLSMGWSLLRLLHARMVDWNKCFFQTETNDFNLRPVSLASFTIYILDIVTTTHKCIYSPVPDFCDRVPFMHLSASVCDMLIRSSACCSDYAAVIHGLFMVGW